MQVCRRVTACGFVEKRFRVFRLKNACSLVGVTASSLVEE